MDSYSTLATEAVVPKHQAPDDYKDIILPI